MINVTEEAGAALGAQLSEDEVESGVAFRLVAGDQGIALGKGSSEPDDVELEQGGKSVLYVPQELAETLDGYTVDVQPSPDNQGMQLVVRPS